MTTIKVLDPTNGIVATESSRAERLATLNGATLGIIDNGKANSDVVMQAIGQRLKDMFHLKDVIYFRKPSSSHPIPDEEAKVLAKQCDGMITGTGD